MTPEFEKRLEEQAISHARQNEDKFLPVELANMPWALAVDAFQSGARWAYQQGIRDVLEKLRSRDTPQAKRYADWLEGQFKND